MHMTGRAGTGAATIRIDSRHQVLHRAFHDGPSRRHFNDVLFSGVFDIGDFRHGSLKSQTMAFIGTVVSASRSGATGVPSAISLRPTIYSGAALTASTAATRPSRRWNTANFRDRGSPRLTSASPVRASPAICSFRSY